MSDLDNYRFKINEIDNQLINLLIDRMKICKKVGEIKKLNNIKILDSNRESEVINKIISIKNKKLLSEDTDILDDNVIKNLWNIIMSHSKNIQINL